MWKHCVDSKAFFFFSGQGVCVYGWVCCLGEVCVHGWMCCLRGVCVHGWVSCYGQKYYLDTSQAGLSGSEMKLKAFHYMWASGNMHGQSPYVSLFMINFIWNLCLIVRYVLPGCCLYEET